MRIKNYRALTLALLLPTSQVYAQDVVEGTVLAFDRRANVIVFTDKSVWPLELLTSPLPQGLKAGDRIEISYQANEDSGITAIERIVVMPPKKGS